MAALCTFQRLLRLFQVAPACTFCSLGKSFAVPGTRAQDANGQSSYSAYCLRTDMLRQSSRRGLAQ